MIGLLKQRGFIHSKRIKEFIDYYTRGENWHSIDLKMGNLGYGGIHYSLIRILQPKRVLVIGSQYGYIPAVCALGCKENQKGLVDFVDAGYNYKNPRHTKHWGGVGFWTKVNFRKHFGKHGLEKYLRLHLMTSNDFSKKFPKRMWEYINIDGDHSYEGIKYDFETFWPKLKEQGVVSIHDIFTKDNKGLKYGVRQYWQELRKKHPHALELPGEFGLGVLQKS